MPDSQSRTKRQSVHGDTWPDESEAPAFGVASGPPVALE